MRGGQSKRKVGDAGGRREKRAREGINIGKKGEGGREKRKIFAPPPAPRRGGGERPTLIATRCAMFGGTRRELECLHSWQCFVTHGSCCVSAAQYQARPSLSSACIQGMSRILVQISP